MQVVDIVVTQVPPKYGDAHLADLGVPAWLRPRLVLIKGAATVALVASARRPRLRSVTAAALVAWRRPVLVLDCSRCTRSSQQ